MSNEHDISEIILKNMDTEYYRNKYDDLKDLDDDQLIEHFKTCGYKEGRFVSEDHKNCKWIATMAKNLDLNFYRNDNPDLLDFNDDTLIQHYFDCGFNENRFISHKHKELVSKFNPEYYKNVYPEFENLSDEEAKDHYQKYGFLQGRFYRDLELDIRDDEDNKSPTGKILVVYVFHELNSRVEMFLKLGVFKSDKIDFMFVCNNPHFKFDRIRNFPNYVLTHTRENTGYDFGAYSFALTHENIYKKYDKYILMNSSCKGPYIPTYYKGNWTEPFIDGLQGDVKLFGAMINPESHPTELAHVQTNIFAIDREALEYLIETEIFDLENIQKKQGDAVLFQEILMSRLIIERGWNIGCLFQAFKDVDFRFIDKSPYQYPQQVQKFLFYGDLQYPQYKNNVWSPYQLIFYKGNR